MVKKKYVILGASRGLGQSLYKNLASQGFSEFLLVSRKINSDHILCEGTEIFQSDFSKNENIIALYDRILNFNPHYIVYCAGGGPYGAYSAKKWSDHVWALQVNFLFPAELIHKLLNSASDLRNLHSLTYIGSKIAENQPDPLASSYAAAKHAMRGLITTLQQEKSTSFAVKLFSPGYMETDLLPLNSSPRLQNKAVSPVEVASQLVSFIDSPELLS